VAAGNADDCPNTALATASAKKQHAGRQRVSFIFFMVIFLSERFVSGFNFILNQV